MDNKIKVLAIIFLLISVGLILSDYYNALMLENYQFDLPDGFSRGDNNRNGDMTITDGVSTIYFTKFKPDDLNKSINSYKDYCKKKNFQIKSENISLNNIDVIKISETETGSCHYWMVHDGIGYSFYTWKKVENSDKIVSDILNKLITS